MRRLMKRAVFPALCAMSLIQFHVREAKAADPCSALVCMAGASGIGSPSPACAPSIAAFHAIQIWGFWGFMANATANARRAYLNTCSGAAMNQPIIETIIAQYGYRP